MAKVCLVILIGLPGSGKSTLTSQLIERISSDQNNATAIKLSFDDLFESTFNKYNTYKTARKEFVTFVECCVAHLTISSPIPNGFNKFITVCNFSVQTNSFLNKSYYLFVDDNNYYRSMRYEYYKIAKKYETSFVQLFLHVDVDLAIKRDQKRQLPVGKNVIEKMSQKLEGPSSINKWEKNSVTLTIDSVDENIIIAFLYSSLENKLKKDIVDEKKPNLVQSDIHQFDVSLRKLINSLVITATTPQQKARIADILNERRKKILEDTKNGIIEINFDSDHLKQLIDFSPCT